MSRVSLPLIQLDLSCFLLGNHEFGIHEHMFHLQSLKFPYLMMAKFYNLNLSPKQHDLLGKHLEFSLYDKTILSKVLDVLLKIFSCFGSSLVHARPHISNLWFFNLAMLNSYLIELAKVSIAFWFFSSFQYLQSNLAFLAYSFSMAILIPKIRALNSTNYIWWVSF